MDPLVLGILLSITFSAFQGVTPQCCIDTARRFPIKLLAKVDKYYVQTSRGACEIDALVLHVGRKKYCADPKLKRKLRRLMLRKNRRKNTPDV